MSRQNNRAYNELRPVFLAPGYAKYADGSCFVKFGYTHLICAATIEEKVPPFLRNTGSGWVTAEYGMLPRCSKDRIEREAAKGKQSGRTLEIQRLIGRSLRSVVDLKGLGERQIKIDCDVLQADGGTRTAAITGGYVALYQAIQKLMSLNKIQTSPLSHFIAAVSCGIVKNEALLDLNYIEDSTAEVDANFVMNDKGEIVELQASAEGKLFSKNQFEKMMGLAEVGIEKLIETQKEVLKVK